MFVSAKFFDHHKAQPLVKAVGVVIENEDDVARQFRTGA